MEKKGWGELVSESDTEKRQLKGNRYLEQSDSDSSRRASGPSVPLEKGQTRDLVAKDFGISGRTYDR